MPTPAIVDFRRTTKGEESAVAADKVVKGEPKTLVKNYFSDPSGQFFAGTWSSGVGKWKVENTDNDEQQRLTCERNREPHRRPIDLGVALVMKCQSDP